MVYNLGKSCLTSEALTSIFDLTNPRTKIEHAKNGFKFASFDDTRLGPIASWTQIGFELFHFL